MPPTPHRNALSPSSVADPAAPATELSMLLGSRICHDIISPLGAIANGVELLQMSGAAQTPEMALIAESVENANARIRFFRVAFGTAPEGQSIASNECRAILEPMGRPRGLVFDWQLQAAVDRSEARLAFLLLACIETALPWGGTVAVSRPGSVWRIDASASRIRAEPALWARVSDGGRADDLPPASALHFAMAGLCAAETGRAIRIEAKDTALHLRF